MLSGLLSASILLLLGGTWGLGCRCCRDKRRLAFRVDPLEVANGRIFMSRAPSIADLGDLRVSCVVSLLSEQELLDLQLEGIEQLPHVQWSYFQLRDKWIPYNSRGFLELLVALLDRLEEGQSILVHCNGGKGRTGLVVAALLMSQQKSFSEALRLMRQKRPGMLRNPLQQLFLLHLQPALRQLRS